MLGRIKDAYAGSGGCGSVDCNRIDNGKKDAEECALVLNVALQDEGVPNSAATNTWQAVRDNYNKLVESCWKATCGAAGSPSK